MLLTSALSRTASWLAGPFWKEGMWEVLACICKPTSSRKDVVQYEQSQRVHEHTLMRCQP